MGNKRQIELATQATPFIPFPEELAYLEEINTKLDDGGAQLVTLNTSYRSTCEIMGFAGRIQKVAGLKTIERHGPVPRVIACASEQEVRKRILALIWAFRESGLGTMGIILKTNTEAKQLYDALREDEDIHLISPTSKTFEPGLSITSVQMAKGLEFDEVLVPNVDDKTYSSAEDRSLLYVACTRAMHRLNLLYFRLKSPLLPG